jgi:hypothetical protein
MGFMMIAYLIFCGLLFLTFVGVGIVSDVMSGPDPEDGYCIKDPLFWGITCAFCIPFVNILVVVFLIVFNLG